MPRLAEVAGGDTEEGERFVGARTDERKRLFAHHLLTIPLAAHFRRILDERPTHRAPWSRFSDELEDHMSPDAAVEWRCTTAAPPFADLSELSATCERSA